MLDWNRHKSVMLSILKGIYSDPSIGPLLGFKGGTAAMLFYGLDRFSVDLDFDLLDTSREQAVFERVGAIAEDVGAIKERHIKRHTVFFLVSYGGRINIKIEINRRGAAAEYAHKSYLGIPMLVMREDDMFAHKLVALTERTHPANRDIYDVWFFLHKEWGFDAGVIEERTGRKVAEHLRACIAHVERTDKTMILSGMGEPVTGKQKAWIREHLIEDALFLLKVRLEEAEGR